jgi:hypothetical protein
VKTSIKLFLLSASFFVLAHNRLLFAQSDFYKGKTITVYIGTTPGALYDQWAEFSRSIWENISPANLT